MRFDVQVEHLFQMLLASRARGQDRAVADVRRHDLQPSPLVALRLWSEPSQKTSPLLGRSRKAASAIEGYPTHLIS